MQGRLAQLKKEASPAVEYAINQEISGNLPGNMTWAGWMRQQYVVNSSLPEDFFDEIQDAVVRVAQERLNAVSMLQQRGLEQSGGSVGTQITKWADINAFDEAVQAMSPSYESQNQRTDFNMNLVPIPYTMIDFDLNVREMESGRNATPSVDTTNSESASRVVAEKLEDQLLNGSSVQVTVNSTTATAPGLTDFGDRVTGSVAAAWSDLSNSSWDPVEDTLDMLGDMPNGFKGNPLGLIVSGDWSHALEQDYSSSKGDSTVRERIMRIDPIEEVTVADKATSEVILVSLTSDTVDLRTIEDIQVVNWDISPFATKFKAFAVQVQRVKSDRNSNAGIVHYT